MAQVNRQIEVISRDMPEIPLPKIASDDAHTFDQCGWAWVEVRAIRNRDAILQAIKKGDFRIGLRQVVA